MGSASDGAIVPANGVVPQTPGSFPGSVPVLLPGPAPWTAPGPMEAERAALQLFSPLQHAERVGWGGGCWVLFLRIRMNHSPALPCTQCILNLPPYGSPGEAPQPHLVLRHCHGSLSNSPPVPVSNDSQGGNSDKFILSLTARYVH